MLSSFLFLLVVTSKDKNFNIYNTVFVLLLLALNSVFSGLLALNVTSERISDSYQLSRNYINQQKGLSLLQGGDTKSVVNIKIDEILNTVNSMSRTGFCSWMVKPGTSGMMIPETL